MRPCYRRGDKANMDNSENVECGGLLEYGKDISASVKKNRGKFLF